MGNYVFRPLFFVLDSVFTVLIYSVLLLKLSIESLLTKVNVVVLEHVFDLFLLSFGFLLLLGLHKELLDSSELMGTFDIFS